MSSYTSTQKFIKLSTYMLMEYNYTTAPTPEQYFVNTGFPAVGFEKIINGHLDESVQILNKPEDQGTTNNVRDLSVVQTGSNKFVTLDNDFLNPYLNFDPLLTDVTDLPVVFPSNIGVYYDTVRFHIVSGYNFDNLDGIILQGKFRERNGKKKATVLQIIIEKGDVTTPILNPNPIYLGGALYDHYIEIKIPAYANMVAEFESLEGSSAQKDTLAAKISSDGNGFLRDTPIEFTLNEIKQTFLKDGYDTYVSQLRGQVSIMPSDNFSDLAAVIKENNFYNYLEYYPTWQGNFIEDFIVSEGAIGNSYYIVNEVELKEQVGLSYITTYNFSNIQTQDFNAPFIFRPVLVNPLTTSFRVNYTMRLVNRGDQTQIIRRSSFNSYEVNSYGKDVNKINLTTGAFTQKVYNKVSQAPDVLAPYGVVPIISPTERKIPIFYKDSNIAVTKETLIVDSTGNLISDTSIPNSVEILGQGKAKIQMDPFDNFYKFTVYTTKDGETPEILDLGTSLSYYMVFLDATGQEIRVENIKNKTTISNPSGGQISFKVNDSESKKILQYTSRSFYIISRSPDSVETKLYSGSWENEKEYLDRIAVEQNNTQINQTSQVTTETEVEVSDKEDNTSINKGKQIIAAVPLTKIKKKRKAYKLGSSSILSVKPRGGKRIKEGRKNNSLPSGSVLPNTINITALATSISGLESQGLPVQKVVNYYFTPGSPGASLFKGLKPSQFLIASLEVHPKLEDGEFNPIYIEYCNALDFPVSENPNNPKTTDI
jgi:hypothetical protein